MAQLIVEIHDTHRRLPAYRHITRFPLSIGRGYTNDIILNDPFVAAEHIVLEVAEDGWVFCNKGLPRSCGGFTTST